MEGQASMTGHGEMDSEEEEKKTSTRDKMIFAGEKRLVINKLHTIKRSGGNKIAATEYMFICGGY